MTWMLASVTSVAEALTAAHAGADLIDLKDPSQGALGALPLNEAAAIRAALGAGRRLSATIGDLPADPRATAEAIEALSEIGVDYVKVGLFTDAHLDACLPVIADLAPRQAIVAVLFADRSTARAAPERFATAGCAGIMLDTADKSAGGLRRHMDLEALRRFVTSARSLGLMTGLAGSLRLTDVPELMRLQPTYLGFRGALCQESDRVKGLDPRQIRAVRQRMLATDSDDEQ